MQVEKKIKSEETLKVAIFLIISFLSSYLFAQNELKVQKSGNSAEEMEQSIKKISTNELKKESVEEIIQVEELEIQKPLIKDSTLSETKKFSQHYFDFGYNGVFFGTGDIFGTALDFEYSYWFVQGISIAARIMLAEAYHLDKGFYFEINYARTYDMSIRYELIHHKNKKLIMSAGGSYRQFRSASGMSYEIEKDYGSYIGYERYGAIESGPHSEFPRDFPLLKDENCWGFTSVLDYRHSLKNFAIGSKFTLQALYENGDIVWGLSLYLGFDK